MLVLILTVAAGEWEPPKDLGTLPADQVRLADTPTLSYFVPALPNGASLTAGDLLRSLPTFSAAPDPTALLQATQAANAANQNEGTALRVLSYNVALLDANVFGIIPYKETPYLKERRDELPALILSEGYDVVCLQEVWRPQDRRRFEKEGEAQGYLAFHGPRGRYNDGLVTLIKKELVSGEAEVYASPYDARDPLEYFPGPKIKRGFIEVGFQHPSLGRLYVYNTHMLAWPANWPTRMAEARQLGARIQAEAAEHLALVAGDMNGGAYYPADTWLNPEGVVETGWWSNTISYAFLQHYGGLVDLVIRGSTPEQAVADVTVGQQIGALTPPNGRPDIVGSCAALGYPNHLTATDCNVLYGMQYKDTEYPTRMDHLFAHDPGNRVYVTEAHTVFTARRSFDGSPEMEPSDHLGVAVTIKVAAP